jgi:hypothetical protein
MAFPARAVAKKALAMEAAAKRHGVGGKLKYACPWQCLGAPRGSR